MSEINQVIKILFESRWSGDSVLKDIKTMRAQLYKTLKDQQAGYWSGHTAYGIAVGGGFLLDGKTNSMKELTAFGQLFMDGYRAESHYER